MLAGGVTTTSHEGVLPGGGGDLTDTDVELDDEISVPPPPLPTSSIPYDMSTHTVFVNVEVLLHCQY